MGEKRGSSEEKMIFVGKVKSAGGKKCILSCSGNAGAEGSRRSLTPAAPWLALRSRPARRPRAVPQRPAARGCRAGHITAAHNTAP